MPLYIPAACFAYSLLRASILPLMFNADLSVEQIPPCSDRQRQDIQNVWGGNKQWQAWLPRAMQSMPGLLVGSISRYLVMSVSAACSLSKPQLDLPLRSNADLFVGC